MSIRRRTRQPSIRECLLAICLLVQGVPSDGFAQTVAEAPSSSQPRTFDTRSPSNYGVDFPYLPPDDPLSLLPSGYTPGVYHIENPEKLDYTTALQEFQPMSNAADFRPSDSVRTADFSNDPVSLSMPVSDVTSVSEIIIGDYGHPVFYDFSRTVANFGMGESLTITDGPLIPDPGMTLSKPMAPRLKVGPWRLAMDALVSSAAIYNVFGSTTNPQTDMAVSLTPRFFVEAGTKGTFRLLYMPTFTRYMRFTNLNTANQNVSVEVRYPFTKLELAAVFSYLTQSGLFLNNQAGGQGTQDSTMLSLSASYPVTRKISSSVIYTGMLQRSDPGGKKLENTIILNTLYGRGDKITLGGSLHLGNVDSPNAGQNYITLDAEVGYRPDYHWRFSARGGVNYRLLDPPPFGVSSPLIEPVFEVMGSYSWTANAVAILKVYRSIKTDTFNAVSLNIQTGVEAALLLRAFRHTDVKSYISYGHTDFYNNAVNSDGNFSFLQGGVSVSYTLVKMVDVMVFGSVQQRFADSQGLNYLSGTLGVGLFLRF